MCVDEQQVHFSVLGPLTAHRAGQVLDLGWAKQQAVLAILLIHPHRPVAANQLIDAVWGEHPPLDARNAIQINISRLRRALRAEDDPCPVVLRVGAGYRLCGDPPQLDRTTFEAHLDSALALHRRGDLPAAATELSAALATWRGDPISGVSSPLIDSERQRLRERHLAAQELRASIDVDSGRCGTAVAELARLVAEHPCHERLRGLLMLALYRCGRYAEALHAFEEARQVLADELGVDPGPELRRLHHQMLVRDPELAAPSEPRPRTRHDLPRDIDDFTGRAAELEALLTTQSRSRAPSIHSIDGMAGVGKTALAVHVAHRLADRYPDGRLFIDLRAHTEGHRPVDPAAALSSLLHALDVPREHLPHGVDERAALWRSTLAGRKILVVLDNAASASQVRPLIPGNPESLVLVTSRRRLVDLESSSALCLETLDPGDAVALFTRIVGAARIEADSDAVAEVLRLCAYLPLAIRIVAARFRTRPAWTAPHLADRLRREQGRLRELAAGDLSVASAFALSYEQLSTSQKRMFRLLGLHPGSDFDTFAAAALCDVDAPSAERMLEDLVDVHLLRQTAICRFRFHDLLRAYAAEMTVDIDDETDRHRALSRLADSYLQAASQSMDVIAPQEKVSRPQVAGPGNTGPALTTYGEAMGWLETERSNLVAVATCVTDRSQSHTDVLSGLLLRYLDMRGHHDDALTLHSHALAEARRSHNQLVECRELGNIGIVYERQGRYDEAIAHHHQALALAETARITSLEARTHNNLGNVYFQLADHKNAVFHYQEALTSAQETGDYTGRCCTGNNLGIVYSRLGRHEEAAALHHEALELATAADDARWQCHALHGQGILSEKLGKHGEALTVLRQALAFAHDTDNRALEGYILQDLGIVHQKLGSHHEAMTSLHEALDIANDTGNRGLKAEVLNGLGETAYSSGDREQAHLCHQQALATARQTGDRYQQARAYRGLSATFTTRDDALHCRQQALFIYTDIDVPEAAQYEGDEHR